MSSYKPVLTVVALLTLLALAAPRVETAAGQTAQAHVQSHHADLAAVALHAALDEAVAVVRTACAEMASLLDSWPTLVTKVLDLFDEWIRAASNVSTPHSTS